MNNYYNVVSYNKLNITTTFYPAPENNKVKSFQDIHPRNYYLPFNVQTNPIGYNGWYDEIIREKDLVTNVTIFLNNMVPESLNIDNDNDGFIDDICLIISPGTNDNWGKILWPHYSTNVYNDNLINGKKNSNYTIILDRPGFTTIVHEMFHVLGAPDLYHYYTPGIPVGTWDIMGGGYGQMCAYMKYRYGGWIDSIPEIKSSGTYTLNLLTSPTNNCYKIKSTNSNTEYFVVEYRERGGYDSWVPCSGLIIYRINPSLYGNSNGPPDEVYAYRPGGTLQTNGDIGGAPFSDSYNRIIFNNTTDPNCFLTDGTLGYINISNISEDISNKKITFTVNPLPKATITPASTTTFCQGGNVILHANTGTGFSYKWQKDGIELIGDLEASYTATLTGYYRVEVTDANTYSNISETIAVTVNPDLPVSVTIVASEYHVCSGTEVTYTATATNGGATPSYQWKVNGVNKGINSTYSFFLLMEIL